MYFAKLTNSSKKRETIMKYLIIELLNISTIIREFWANND